MTNTLNASSLRPKTLRSFVVKNLATSRLVCSKRLWRHELSRKQYKSRQGYLCRLLLTVAPIGVGDSSSLSSTLISVYISNVVWSLPYSIYRFIVEKLTVTSYPNELFFHNFVSRLICNHNKFLCNLNWFPILLVILHNISVCTDKC